uniref:Fibronectin type-III domain-containing protein n=1 Tax=Amphilophus citrinellus TaxID=61819 RepID=A0A3Q0QT81_AMPCI
MWNNQTNGFNLDCTNDFDELMMCQLELKNCTEYSMILRNRYREKNCTLQQCGTEQCCCSFQLILPMTTPTIISVKESNGNFEVSWNSNMMGFINDELTAEVTYYKKGETTKISKSLTPAIVNGLNYYEINGQDLDPSSTYVVSVRSFIKLSGRFSDSSTEWEFETSFPPRFLLLTIIFSFSITAVIFSIAIYGCYVLKPEPPITSSVCVEPLIPDDSKLGSKMSLTDTSSGSLQQSSGISTGSSALSYANAEPPDHMNDEPPTTKAVHDVLAKLFPNIQLISPLTTTTTSPLTQFMNMQNNDLCSAPYSPCGVQANDTSSGSSIFENKTYSLLIPGCAHQAMTNNSEFKVKAEMPCDSDYHPSRSDMERCPDQQVPACQVPAQQDSVSSLMQADMSYQPCNGDSGRFSCAEDSSLSSISSGTNTSDSCDLTSRAEVEFESSDEIVSGKAKLCEEVTICDECPCYGFVPRGSHSFLAMDEDYQAVPGLLLEQGSGGHKEILDRYKEESFKKAPQSILSQVFPDFINSVQDGQHLSQLQIPFSSLMLADHSLPVITDSGYQSV